MRLIFNIQSEYIVIDNITIKRPINGILKSENINSKTFDKLSKYFAKPKFPIQ